MQSPIVIPQEPVQRVVPAPALEPAIPQITDAQLSDLLGRIGAAGQKGGENQRRHLYHCLLSLTTIAEDYEKPEASRAALEASYTLVNFCMEDLRLAGQPMPIALIEVTEKEASAILGPGGARDMEVKINVSISSPATACLAYLTKNMREGVVFDSQQVNETIKENTVLIDGMRAGAQSIEDHLVKFKAFVAAPKTPPESSPIVVP